MKRTLLSALLISSLSSMSYAGGEYFIHVHNATNEDYRISTDGYASNCWYPRDIENNIIPAGQTKRLITEDSAAADGCAGAWEKSQTFWIAKTDKTGLHDFRIAYIGRKHGYVKALSDLTSNYRITLAQDHPSVDIYINKDGEYTMTAEPLSSGGSSGLTAGISSLYEQHRNTSPKITIVNQTETPLKLISIVNQCPLNIDSTSNMSPCVGVYPNVENIINHVFYPGWSLDIDLKLNLYSSFTTYEDRTQVYYPNSIVFKFENTHTGEICTVSSRAELKEPDHPARYTSILGADGLLPYLLNSQMMYSYHFSGGPLANNVYLPMLTGNKIPMSDSIDFTKGKYGHAILTIAECHTPTSLLSLSNTSSYDLSNITFDKEKNLLKDSPNYRDFTDNKHRILVKKALLPSKVDLPLNSQNINTINFDTKVAGQPYQVNAYYGNNENGPNIQTFTLRDGTVKLVDLYHSENQLYYRIGTYHQTSGNNPYWTFTSGHAYDNGGASPSLAVFTLKNGVTKVVTVHHTGDINHRVLSYRVGEYNAKTDTIDFSDPVVFDKGGMDPAISAFTLANGEVRLLEVHKSGNATQNAVLSYRVGEYDEATDKVQFKAPIVFDKGGINPAIVSFTDSNGDIRFIEAHQTGEIDKSALSYRIGKYLPQTHNIEFSDPVIFDNGGVNVSLSAYTDGAQQKIIEFHQTQGVLTYRIGQFDLQANKLNFGKRNIIDDNNINPSVSTFKANDQTHLIIMSNIANNDKVPVYQYGNIAAGSNTAGFYTGKFLIGDCQINAEQNQNLSNLHCNIASSQSSPSYPGYFNYQINFTN